MKPIKIKNNLRQVLSIVVRGKGTEIPPLGVKEFPNGDLGPDVAAKLRKKLITVT